MYDKVYIVWRKLPTVLLTHWKCLFESWLMSECSWVCPCLTLSLNPCTEGDDDICIFPSLPFPGDDDTEDTSYENKAEEGGEIYDEAASLPVTGKVSTLPLWGCWGTSVADVSFHCILREESFVLSGRALSRPRHIFLNKYHYTIIK